MLRIRLDRHSHEHVTFENAARIRRHYPHRRCLGVRIDEISDVVDDSGDRIFSGVGGYRGVRAFAHCRQIRLEHVRRHPHRRHIRDREGRSRSRLQQLSGIDQLLDDRAAYGRANDRFDRPHRFPSLNRRDGRGIDPERMQLLERSIAVGGGCRCVRLCLLNVTVRDCIRLEQFLVERGDPGQLSVRRFRLAKGGDSRGKIG